MSLKKIDFNKYINYLIISLAFVIPISYSFRDIILSLIIVLWILEGNFKEKWEKLKKNINIALLAYLGVFIIRFLSNFWSSSLNEGSYKAKFYLNSMDYVFRYDFFYLSIIIIVLTSFNVKYTKKVISSFILGMFVSEIVSYGIILGFWRTRIGMPYNPTPFLANHSTYSLFLVIAIFWILEFAYREKEKWKKILYYLFSLTATANLFFNAGRTGQVIYIFLIFFYAFYHYRSSIKKIVLILLAGVFGVLIFYKISHLFQHRVSEAKRDIVYMINGHFNTSWGGRMLAWFVAKDIFIKHPLMGVGVGSVKKEMFEEVAKYGKSNAEFFNQSLPHLHNQFLQILAETGLVGEFLFIVALIFLFKEKYKKDVDYYVKVFLIAYLIAFMTETFLMKNTSYLLFNLFIAVFMLNRERYENISIWSK